MLSRTVGTRAVIDSRQIDAGSVTPLSFDPLVKRLGIGLRVTLIETPLFGCASPSHRQHFSISRFLALAGRQNRVRTSRLLCARLAAPGSVSHLYSHETKHASSKSFQESERESAGDDERGVEGEMETGRVNTLTRQFTTCKQSRSGRRELKMKRVELTPSTERRAPSRHD